MDGNRRTSERMALEERLIIEFFPRCIDEVVHGPLGHSLKIDIRGQLRLTKRFDLHCRRRADSHIADLTREPLD